MKFIIAMITTFASLAYAAESTVSGSSNVNVCQPTIEVKNCNGNCCPKPKVVTKVVEKVVEKEVEKIVEKRVDLTKKNHISLVAGVGPKGNLKVEQNGNQYNAATENGPVVGIQYMRALKSRENYSVDGLVQVQSNRTFMIGVGVGF